MAGSTRFELASSSPEGSAFGTSYPNAQRGMYSAASLDRSGSFRESIENRTLNPGPAQSRGSGGALSGEIPSLSQYMSLEQMSLGEQKYTRTGELRRALNVSLGATSEEHLYIQSNKPIPPVSSEELKRFKASVFESSARARYFSYAFVW